MFAVIMRFLVGLGISAAGFGMVFKPEIPLELIGRVQWAEQYLGYDGGSKLFYKLVGTAVSILGVIVATGAWEWLFMSTLGRFLFMTVPNK